MRLQPLGRDRGLATFWFLNDVIKASDASLRVLRCTPMKLTLASPAANADVRWAAYVGADALRGLYASLDERGLDEKALRLRLRELLMEYNEPAVHVVRCFCLFVCCIESSLLIV